MTYNVGQPKTLFTIVGKWRKIENVVRERMKPDEDGSKPEMFQERVVKMTKSIDMNFRWLVKRKGVYEGRTDSVVFLLVSWVRAIGSRPVGP